MAEHLFCQTNHTSTFFCEAASFTSRSETWPLLRLSVGAENLAYISLVYSGSSVATLFFGFRTNSDKYETCSLLSSKHYNHIKQTIFKTCKSPLMYWVFKTLSEGVFSCACVTKPQHEWYFLKTCTCFNTHIDLSYLLAARHTSKQGISEWFYKSLTQMLIAFETGGNIEENCIMSWWLLR